MRLPPTNIKDNYGLSEAEEIFLARKWPNVSKFEFSQDFSWSSDGGFQKMTCRTTSLDEDSAVIQKISISLAKDLRTSSLV